MLLKYCPFCHRQVLWLLFTRHLAKHTRLLPDGQMTDHVTVAEQDRYQGSLAGVPQVYEHPACGGRTGMPEEIVRSYLVNPFIYSGATFCCGCGDYIRHEELVWVETCQGLADYFKELQQEFLEEFGETGP